MLQELQDSKIERETAEEHFAELTARLEQYQNKVWQYEFGSFLSNVRLYPRHLRTNEDVHEHRLLVVLWCLRWNSELEP